MKIKIKKDIFKNLAKQFSYKVIIKLKTYNQNLEVRVKQFVKWWTN